MIKAWAALLATMALSSLVLAIALLLNTGSDGLLAAGGKVPNNIEQAQPVVNISYPAEIEEQEQKPGVAADHESILLRLETDHCSAIRVAPSGLYPEQDFASFQSLESPGWADGNACDQSHRILLTDLQPDTEYLIEVSAKASKSTPPTQVVLSHRTHPEPELDLVQILNDASEDNELIERFDTEEERKEASTNVFEATYEFLSALYNWM